MLVLKSSSILTSTRPNMYIRFLLFGIFCAFSLGSCLFTVPVYLAFNSGLGNCDLHRTESGCLSSTEAGCLWIAENETADSSSPFVCKFPDYKTVTCSLFNNNSDLCSGSCEYLFADQRCVHKAGFSGLETGIFSASTVAGGWIGPIFSSKFSSKFGYPATFFVFSVLSFIAAGLFTGGIEADSFGLWVSSRIINSIVGEAAPALFADCTKEHAGDFLSEDTQTQLNQAMGCAINFAGFFVSLFLFIDMPRGDFADDPNFKLKLQNFNIVQWLFSVLWIIFGLSLIYPKFFDEKICSCYSSFGNKEDNKENEDNDSSQQQHSPTTKNIPEDNNENNNNSPASVDISSSSPSNEPTSTASCSESNTTNIKQSEDVIRKDDSEENKDEDEDDDDSFYLQYITAALAICVQQMSSIGALNAYIPLILQSVLKDPFLAQLCFASGLVVGSLISVLFLGKLLHPRTIFVGSGIVCGFCTLLIGLSMFPGIISSDSAVEAISLFSVILFALSFGSGAGTEVFAVLAKTFSAKNLKNGLTTALFISVTIQVIMRLVFPIFVENVGQNEREGRGIAFFGFTGLETVFVILLIVSLKFLWGRRSSSDE